MQMLGFRNAWSAVMDEKVNPLKNYATPTAHMLMQLLAWMWSIVFSLAVGSYFVFGITAIAHVLIIGAIFTTLAVFHDAQQH